MRIFLEETFEFNLLQEIEQYSSFISVKSGETILDVGQTIRFMPIILSGTVKVSRIDEDGRELLLYYLGENESCAMTFTCCMMLNQSEIRAIAEEDSEILLLPTSVMDSWIAKYPTWKSFVMKTIRTRFNELLKTIDQIAFQNLDERLVSYLKTKAQATNSSLINLSHQQIADELASSRVVISRLLKKLENDGKIILFRNQIKVLRAL